MNLPSKRVIIILLLIGLACLVMIVVNKNNLISMPISQIMPITHEGFQDTPGMDKIQADVSQMSEAELKSTLEAMKSRLTKYGLLPGDVEPQIDRSQWVPKSNIPPAGPRIDMSQYVKKSSIPPEKVCPPQKEIDYSEYVKKSTLPPTQKCPPCISPKVKVSAGLCKKCPPCPSCPPPQRCPELQCPEPKPVPKVECPKCSEIKYIKVPTIITRTIKVDKDDKVISENVEEKTETTQPEAASMMNKVGGMFRKAPTTTIPVETSEIPITTRMENKKKAESCSVIGLNSDFKKFGIYGLE
jgi:hypothetical protein